MKGVTPEALLNRPEIPWLLDDYLKAYRDLDRRRQIGYSGPQPLSVSDIFRYAETHGFSSTRQFFFKVISALDDYNLEKHAEKEKRRQEQEKSKGKRAGRGRRR